MIILIFVDIITQNSEKCKRISPNFEPTKRTSFRGAFGRIMFHREAQFVTATKVRNLFDCPYPPTAPIISFSTDPRLFQKLIVRP